MKPLKVYIDTSVFGGAFDAEFQEPSRIFFDEIRAGKFLPVISTSVLDEIELAPDKVKNLFEEVYLKAEEVFLSDEAIDLRDHYLKGEVVTKTSEVDALHVALATISGCTMIVSWNFKHIVHFQKIPLYNGINQMRGYRAIGIYSPLEVIYGA